MSEYFDKDFFKFLCGFIAILAMSFTFIILTRAYEESTKIQAIPIIHNK